MPELPEVEATRLSLAAQLEGARIEAVRFGKPLRWAPGCDAAALVGLDVLRLRRRGKYLLLDLSRGLLLVHLGMSGSLSLSAAPPAPGTHDHFDLVTDRGTLRLQDPRRFGAVVYAESQDAPSARRLLARLGVEPLGPDFDADTFYLGLQRRGASIKQVLLAGDLVVGVGNIYASEALFLARIRPTLAASKISRARAHRLHAAVRDVLARALASGGSTLRNFSNAHREPGRFQLEVMVYDRGGLPCKVCATPIRTIRQGQRATHFCPQCQRR